MGSTTPWRWAGWKRRFDAIYPRIYPRKSAAGGLRLRFASHWVRTRLADEVAAGFAGRLPVGDRAHESSLWAVTAGPATGP